MSTPRTKPSSASLAKSAGPGRATVKPPTALKGGAPDVPPELAQAINENKCALFVGAGFSVRAGYPNWKTLLGELIQRCTTLANISVRKQDELKALVETPDKYLMLAQELNEILGPEEFMSRLVAIFSADHSPTATHEELTKVPFSMVVTTNYDQLLENAYAKAEGKIPPCYNNSQASDFADSLWKGKFFILKAHGDVNHRTSMVITERDYRKIIHSAPGYRSVMSAIFTMKTVLFVGVSLSDPELELLLDYSHDAFYGGAPLHYALVSDREFGETAVNRWRKDYRVNCLTYTASAGHPEVDSFLKALPHRKPKPSVK